MGAGGRYRLWVMVGRSSGRCGWWWSVWVVVVGMGGGGRNGWPSVWVVVVSVSGGRFWRWSVWVAVGVGSVWCA